MITAAISSQQQGGTSLLNCTSPSAPELMVLKLKQIIEYSLNHFLYDNALFFAERLQASVTNLTCNLVSHKQDAALTLATCYFHKRQFKQAYMILRDCQAPACRFLFAKCCEELHLFSEGESALVSILPKDGSLSWKGGKRLFASSSSTLDSGTTISAQIPDLAVIFCLLGRLCRRSNRVAQSIDHFQTAINLNPMLWEAYEELCIQGVSLDVSKLYNVDQISSAYPWASPPLPLSSSSHSNSNASSMCSEDTADNYPSNAIFNVNGPTNTENVPSSRNSITASPSLTMGGPVNSAEMVTLNSVNSKSSKIPARLPSSREPARKKPRIHASDNESFDHSHSVTSNNTPVRRSSRLNHSKPTLSASSTLNNAVNPSKKRGRQTNPNDISTAVEAIEDLSAISISEKRQPASSGPLNCLSNNDHANDVALNYLSNLLQKLGLGYLSLCRFSGREAIEIFNSLPPEHYQTGWVLNCIGKAHFECVEYAAAERVFEKMRMVEPYRVKGLEIYSTLLWHLQKDANLSFLARDLIEFDKMCPQTWCAAGNCFSLQKDHESALRCFQRAIQLDPFFSYAYTLSGHEHVSNEDFEKAAVCFRNSIRVDQRHYNAWYGLGMIYYRQEKFELAEFHFQKALEINSNSSVLYCYLGMVLHATKRFEDSLNMYVKASQIDPYNPLVKFKKAKLLFHLEQYRSALLELEALKEMTPKESAVFYLMGQIYKKMGQKQKAMIHFTWAYDLDPKGSAIIKEAIDSNQLDSADDEIHAETSMTSSNQ